jgi:hypothetical protein
MGEGAGTVAARAVALGKLPDELDFDRDVAPHWTLPHIDATARRDYPTAEPAAAS